MLADTVPQPEVISAPSVERRWKETGEAWVAKQRLSGRYMGRNGQTAIRLCVRVGELLRVPPTRVRVEEALAVGDAFGEQPKTKRFYMGLLGQILLSAGNPVVQEHGLVRRIPTFTRHPRYLTPAQLSAVMDRAIGLERVVLALEGFQGLRRVELQRARVSDIDTSGARWWLRVRGKAYGGRESRDLPVGPQLRAELAWYLQLRAKWAETATDCPELLVWDDAGRLRPFSHTSIDRYVQRAGRRAGIRLSNHDLRRTFGRMLRELGADWREIAGLLGHRSIATTEAYVGVQSDRMERAVDLLAGASRVPAPADRRNA